jgi:hypothetical protein
MGACALLLVTRVTGTVMSLPSVLAIGKRRRRDPLRDCGDRGGVELFALVGGFSFGPRQAHYAGGHGGLREIEGAVKGGYSQI